MKILRNLIIALICATTTPGMAVAQTSFMYINVIDYTLYPNGHFVTGPTVCANVLEATPNSGAASQQIESTTAQVINGQARFQMPQDRSYQNLFFEGRVRFVVMDPGHCPVACDIDFFWNYGSPQAVPEYNCRVDLADAQLGSYACNNGSSPTTSYAEPTYFTPEEGGLPLSTAEIDGIVQRYIGDTAAHRLTCPGRTIRTPRVPEIVPLNPVELQPRLPQSPIDPNLVNPDRGHDPLIQRR